MKSIKSLAKWILFVPVCLMSVTLITLCGLNPELIKNYFTTDMNGIAEIISFSILGLFLVCFVLSLFDRTTSPVHLLKKNYFCGAMAFVGAFGLAATAALDVTTMIQTNTLEIVSVITAVFSALSGLAFLFIGLNHFSGANTPKEISAFYLSLPLWCGVHLIDRFLKHTAMPVDAADTLDLIMFVALALFFINAMMIHAVIPGKNAVKSAVTYGFPATVISIVYGISLIFNVVSTQGSDFIDYIPAVTYCVIGLYVLGFTAELSFKSKSVEEQKVVDTVEDTEHKEDITETEETYEEEPSVQEVESLTSDTSESDSDMYDEFEDSSYEDDTDYEDVSLFDDAEPTAVRVVEDEEEDELSDYDIPVNLPEVNQETKHSYVAEELYRAAQQRDLSKIYESESELSVAGSEEEMIIDGEELIASAPAGKGSDADSKPKGPTTREAIMYEDEDFILAIDGSDIDDGAPAEKTEDISSFILESQDEPEITGKVVEKTYADRLDEIDQLIISIQGADSSTEE